MSERRENTYLIPKRLLKKNTIFTGIGGKELLIIGLGLIAGVLLYLLFSGLMFILKIILLAIPPGICYFLVCI